MKDLLRFYKGKYIVFDFETESLNLKFSRPWQAAYIAFNGNSIVKKSLNLLWNDLNISDGAAFITRFNFEQYRKTAVDAKEALLEFNKYVYDEEYLVLFFNGLNFDIYQHKSWSDALGVPHSYDYLSRCIDVHCLYKAYKFEQKVDNSDLEAWQRKLTFLHKRGVKTSLSAMAKEFQLNLDETKTHEGLYDSELTIQGFDKLRWMMDIQSPI